MESSKFGAVVVGGGLQGSLLALRLLQAGVSRIALVELSSSLGGNHTWCFHQGDVTPDQNRWLEPLVVHRWQGYDVQFRGLQRGIDTTYSAVTSARLHEYVTSQFDGFPEARLFTNSSAIRLDAHRVLLDGGSELAADHVIDARGPDRYPTARSAFQKFVGLEVELNAPHNVSRAILMDATVSQLDGFRFVYTLPFGSGRLLIEDTYFSSEPTLDVDAITERIRDYAEQKHWSIARVIRSERGVLPLPLSHGAWPSNDYVLRAGYRGGWFHPVTGYSFPIAARLAETIALGIASGDLIGRLDAVKLDHRRQFRFGVVLNQLLYGAFAPEERWNVFERFYRLPDETIERFYAHDTRAIDRARILCGKPPTGFSIRRALSRGKR